MRPAAVIAACLLGMLVAGCGSDPPRLYVLTAPTPQPAPAAIPTPRVIGILPVALPQYLDRSELIVRRTATELAALDGDRWAEPLGANATRVLAQNLAARLPGYRVVALPDRALQRADFELFLSLDAFEADETGSAVLAGEWSVVDPTSGSRRAGGRVAKATPLASRDDAGAIAAALSREIAELSAEIAQQIEALSRREPPRTP